MKSFTPSTRLHVPPSSETVSAPQVKICGITTPADARLCVEAGADALGLVFHPRSSRYVTPDRAEEVRRAVPEGFPLVGVFVDVPEAGIRRTAERLRLSAVQLHGEESPAVVDNFRRAGFRVIKALFAGRKPGFEESPLYSADAFLVEPGIGALPGGSGAAWAWTLPAACRPGAPLILAGGLHAGNVAEAIRSARPEAVDVSSGVESAPGRKDPERVQAFVEVVRSCPIPVIRRRIF